MADAPVCTVSDCVVIPFGGRGAIITGANSPEFDIVVRGERIRFELHWYCGPTPLTKRGGVRELGPRHPFWLAATLWLAQGKRIGNEGLCIWEPEPEPELIHLWGKHYFRGTPEEAEAFKAKAAATVAAKDARRGRKRCFCEIGLVAQCPVHAPESGGPEGAC